MSTIFYDIDLEKESEIEDWLEIAVGQERFKRGPERVENFIKLLVPEIRSSGIRITTVAGTNGKGETSTTLAHLLHQKGRRVALWLSPHILSIRERILFEMMPLSYEEFFEGVKATFQKGQNLEINLSYYELLFCFFLETLLKKHREKPIDHLILEVGIGGRLDAVNHLDAHCVAITSISRDHEDLLGRGFKKILNEKMGIMRPGAPCFTSLELNYLQGIVEERSQLLNCPHYDLFAEKKLNKKDNYSIRNRLLALTIFSYWENLTTPRVEELSSFHFPQLKGRSEVMTLGERRFIFIGSHNLDGIRKLVNTISKDPEVKALLVAFSKRSYEEEIGHLVKLLLSDKQWSVPIYFTQFDHAKSYKFDSGIFQGLNNGERKVEWVNDWKKFVTEQNNGAQKLLVTGSFYFVGTVERYLLQQGGALS